MTINELIDKLEDLAANEMEKRAEEGLLWRNIEVDPNHILILVDHIKTLNDQHCFDKIELDILTAKLAELNKQD